MHMKKTPFAAFAALICFLISCSSKDATGGKLSGKAQKNLDAYHIVADAFMSGDASKIDDAVAGDFIDHSEKGDVAGRDSLKSMIKWMHASNKDMKSQTVKEFADDDYVFSWMTYSGTSDGTGGMPNGPYTMNSLEVVKFKDGKATEHWAFVNAAEMMKMMSTQHPMENKMDTTKKM
jgi:predicted SnoaL-like aldol condensation-catalyzing enzyme